MIHPFRENQWELNRRLVFFDIAEMAGKFVPKAKVGADELDELKDTAQVKAEEGDTKETLEKKAKSAKEEREREAEALGKKVEGKMTDYHNALAQVPSDLRGRMKEEIIAFILRSPGRFDVDGTKGLDGTEWKKFSNSMVEKADSIINEFAPTDEEIEDKEKAEKAAEEAAEMAEKAKDLTVDELLEQIQGTPPKIDNLTDLSTAFGNYHEWNTLLQQKGLQIIEESNGFYQKYAEFQQAREGARAYKKFGDFLSLEDSEIVNLGKDKWAAVENLEQIIKKLQKTSQGTTDSAEDKLARYAKKLGEESNKLREEKNKERDKHLKRIKDDRENLSDEEKAQRQEALARIKGEKETLEKGQKDLLDYKDNLEKTRHDVYGGQKEAFEKREEELGLCSSILSNQITEIDAKLSLPMSEGERQALVATRKMLLEKRDAIDIGYWAVGRAIESTDGKIEGISTKEIEIANKTYVIQTHLDEQINPSIEALSGHIALLDTAVLELTDSEEVIKKHYENIYPLFDTVDESIDSAILSHSLANEKIVGNLEKQKNNLSAVDIDRPGAWDLIKAPIQIAWTPLRVAGDGMSYMGNKAMDFGTEILDQAYQLDQELESARKDGMNPAAYWTAKTFLEIGSTAEGLGIALPLELGGGLLALGGGLIGRPVNTVKGLGALAGRNPTTGTWFDGTGAESWGMAWEAMTAEKYWERGQYGAALGKTIGNIGTFFLGGGALAQAAKTTAQAAKAASAVGNLSKFQIAAMAATQGAKAFGTGLLETGRSLMAAPSKIVGAAKATPGAISGIATKARELGVSGMSQSAIDGASQLARNMGDKLASKSELGRRLFGEEAYQRGLSQQQNALLSDLVANVDDYELYKKQFDEIKAENPNLSDADIRRRIMEEDFDMFYGAVRFEQKYDEFVTMKERQLGNERNIDKPPARETDAYRREAGNETPPDSQMPKDQKTTHTPESTEGYHLALDPLTEMRGKQMLYTPDGIRHLQDVFGSEVSMTFTDVTGMGIGNKYLGATEEIARSNVDAMFKVMKEVADEVFEGRPFEIVRFGGDEIIFLTRKADVGLMDNFYRRFNQRKEEALVEAIGREAYETAKFETNVKAQQKLISKDPGYIEASRNGTLDQWFETQGLSADELMTNTSEASRMRLLAIRNLSEDTRLWLEPLDIYHGRPQSVELADRKPTEVRRELMDSVAKADDDIAWQKGHPGQDMPADRAYGGDVMEAGAKYEKEAQAVTEFAERLKGLESELVKAEKVGDIGRVAELRREIMTIKTRDSGTGAIRLDKAKYEQVRSLMDLSADTTSVHVTRVDVEFFGAYNNHLGYATADEMMTKLKYVLQDEFGIEVEIVRDGGNLLVISEKAPTEVNIDRLQKRLNETIEPYANPDGISSIDRRASQRRPNRPGEVDRREGMEREVEVKRSQSGSKAEFGTASVHGNIEVPLQTDATLWDVVNPAL